jgi:hypothetical protein
MAYIGKTPVIGNFQICDAITVVDAQAAYTMQVGGVDVSPESANHMLVSLNGILQAPTTSYTVSGSTITFASALETGDVIDFIQILGNVLDLGVPSDNTVSLAKLTATGTKDATTFLRGDNTFAAPSGGKVLQVVSATDNTERTTTSTSFGLNSSTLTLNITPSSTNNKIYVIASFNQSTGGNDGVFTIFRDSTNLGSATYGLAYILSEGGYWYGGQTISVFETAPSTSALTYQVRFRSGSGNTITLNEGPALGNITALEIEG